MKTKIIMYIGADNETRMINEEYEQTIVDILSKYYENFTLKRCEGYWEGNIEDSIEAVIIVLQFALIDLRECVNELRVKLVQDKIGVEVVAEVDFKLR